PDRRTGSRSLGRFYAAKLSDSGRVPPAVGGPAEGRFMSNAAVGGVRIHQGIVPGYLLARLARSDRYQRAAQAARQTLIAGRPPFRSTLELSIDAEGSL